MRSERLTLAGLLESITFLRVQIAAVIHGQQRETLPFTRLFFQKTALRFIQRANDKWREYTKRSIYTEINKRIKYFTIIYQL